MLNPHTRQTNSPWSSADADRLWLLTPDELKEVPDGTELTCINGEKVVLGRDYVDGDTRSGLVAYGLLESQVAAEES